FSSRSLRKTYLALVHGELKQDSGTINAPVSRDLVRRTRMTTRRTDSGRTAISHYKVLRRLNTRYGRFSLVSVRIETGVPIRFACIWLRLGIRWLGIRFMARRHGFS